MRGLTTTELRLVEQYASVLDFVSRCAQAIDGGNWNYLLDKARQLEYAAERLTDVATEADKVSRQQRRPRAEVVRAAVAHYGRYYRAGRLLHPVQPPRRGGADR